MTKASGSSNILVTGRPASTIGSASNVERRHSRRNVPKECSLMRDPSQLATAPQPDDSTPSLLEHLIEGPPEFASRSQSRNRVVSSPWAIRHRVAAPAGHP